MISRRRFLQAGTAAGAFLAWPIRAFPFSQSPTPILKFKVALPGLVADGSNTPGIPVLSKTSSGTPNGQPDVYEVEAAAFTQDLLGAASDIGHATRLWGWGGIAPPQYLGGVIMATGGKNPIPVQVKVTNNLPSSHILPVDPTIIDPASGEAEFADRHDRLTVHLHGGRIFWDSDGNPFLWFSNAKNPPGFVHGSSFINGDPEHPGTAIYNYQNQSSARMMWYHDHAYGLTRGNIYAGLISLYLLTDQDQEGEAGLIAKGIIPGADLPDLEKLGIPLVIQDKTFWDPNGSDPDYPKFVPTGANEGDLWYPHEYESALAADLPSMSLPPTPPFNPARWELGAGATSTLPAVSTVAEFFADTILINGAPYPTLEVDPKRYRFRVLNGSNSRFYNLQLYVADPASVDGISLMPIPTGDLDPNDNVILVPDPAVNPPGPAFIQIANEGGFLPAPALFSSDPATNANSNRFLTYKLSPAARSQARRADAGRMLPFRGDLLRFTALPGDPTTGNAASWNLLLGPAERADFLVDFRGWPAGTEFILYSDAPAPFPGGDTRNDYFVFNPTNFGLPANYTDLRPIGGAAPTMPGQGPDTRVLMKFILSGANPSTEPDFAATVAALQDPASGLPFVFANTQPTQPLPEGRTLVKTLGEDFDKFGRLRQYMGNALVSPRTFVDFPTEVAVNGEVQTWQIYNTTGDTHPIHFHLVNVEVVGRDQWAFNPDGTPMLPLQILPGTHTDPDPNELGWREMVRMNPGEVTTVRMQFSLPTGTPPQGSPRLLASYGINGAEYVWHCHILEHEEHDMMRPLVVIEP